jgi:Zn ribbon nucleic-acid-binding protein
MRNLAKLIVVSVSLLLAVFAFSCGLPDSASSTAQLSGATPTPQANSNANRPANSTSAPPATSSGAVPGEVLGQSITKKFVLGKDSLSEYGESPFDHATHALQKYSPDGNSVVACVECHHTDQPKSALKPPLLTSERDVALTLDTWKTSKQKVSECRACHFQEGDVPDDKEMPTASYTEGGKTTVKNLNNELAYHINCNTCHDAAFKLRPTLKSKPGFATSKDCATCHVVTK